jgi:MFS superfamily sulfate permease-like transporter
VAIEEPGADLRQVVIDLRYVPYIDLTACQELLHLRDWLVERQQLLLLARPQPDVEAKLRRSGLGEAILPRWSRLPFRPAHRTPGQSDASEKPPPPYR